MLLYNWNLLVDVFVQDGEEWIFTVRKFESLPERTTVVNYEGFAEGICFHPLACTSWWLVVSSDCRWTRRNVLKRTLQCIHRVQFANGLPVCNLFVSWWLCWADVRVGDELVVDGGMVRFEVIEKIGPDVKCKCTDPGLLLPRANLTFWREGRLVRERNAMLPTISSKVLVCWWWWW